MASGVIVNAWKDSTNAYVAVSVNEGAPHGVVEYIASTPLQDSQGNALTLAQLKANLLTAISAQRSRMPQPPTNIGSLSGAVTV